MDKKKLLIADSNEAFCVALESVLQDDFYIQIADNGNKAQELLDNFRPEVLVLDVTLAELDGIHLLERAARHGHKLKTLVTMLFCSDYLMARLTGLEISYAMLKPCDLQITAERVREIAADAVPIAAKSDEEQLTEILLQLSVNPKHNGYHYLCTAVKTFLEDNTQSLTKELYVAVGAVYGVHWQQVERSIRAALEAAWKHRDEQIWRKWFPGISVLKRPTNGEVISRLAELLRMQQTRKIG